MKYIITPEKMRGIENEAFVSGIKPIDLMERAAKHVARKAWDIAAGARTLFLCGPGNNGGDGLAAARIYRSMGGDARVALLASKDKMTPCSLENLAYWLSCGGNQPDGKWEQSTPALAVDALFGTGLTRAPEGEYKRAIEWMNDRPTTVLSADIPSGVNASDGSIPGAAVTAHYTVTFHMQKTGHVLFPGRGTCGEISVTDIGLPYGAEDGGMRLLCGHDISALLPPRERNTHKGTYGHVLIIAGSLGMAGAAALAARGAVAAGAGLVSVACCGQSVLPIVQKLVPEAMCIPLPEDGDAISYAATENVKSHFEGKTVIAVGPGMRVCAGSRAVVAACLESGLPLIMDADALNCLARYPALWEMAKGPLALTPHPGEMNRLTGGRNLLPHVNARMLAKERGVTILLKGSSTFIVNPQGETTVNLTGTPAMARGGSGDTLTGIIAALTAQGLSLYNAASLGAYLHGRAGERAESRHGLGFPLFNMLDYLW